MAKSVLADLVLKLSTNSAELTKGLKEANKGMSGLQKSADNMGANITKSLATAAAGYLTVSGALKAFTTVMHSTELATDRYAGVQKGLSIGTQALAASIANLDFTNMIAGFMQAYKAGKDYQAMLDDIEDRQISLGIIEAKTGLDIAKWQRILRDETSSASEKLDAQNNIIAAQGKLTATQLSITQARIDAEKLLMSNLLPGKKLTEEQVNLMATYSAEYEYLSTVQKEQITQAGKLQQTLFNKEEAWAKQRQTILERQGHDIGATGPGVEKARKAYENFLLTLDDTARSYAGVGAALNLFSGDARERYAELVKAHINYQTAQVTTESLVDRLGKKVKKTAEEEEAYALALAKTNAQLNMRKDPIAAPGAKPTVAGPVALPTGLIDVQLAVPQVNAVDPALIKLYETTNLFNELESPFLFITDSFEALNDSLIAGADNFKEFGKQVKSTVKGIIGAYLAESIAAAISSALKNPAIAINPLLIPIIAAAAGGLAKTAFNSLIPSFAAGGIVSGPTMGLMGEYPGAKFNPEVIAPLSDLKAILGDSGAGEVRFVIEQNQLIGILEKANNRNIYF